MQTQQPVWKFLQKHNVVSFVVKTGVAAVVGLITVSSVSVNLNGELAYSAANCIADEHTYTVAHGDTWSTLAARFHLKQELLRSHNRQISKKALVESEKMCIPVGEQHMVVNTKASPLVSVAKHSQATKKAIVMRFRARAVPAPRVTTSPVSLQATPSAAANAIQGSPLIMSPAQTASHNAVGGTNPFPYPACTWWADERYSQTHGHYVPWSNGADAWQWSLRAAQYGWHVSGLPAAGSILVLQPYVEGAGEYGHVAYVEQVLDNNHVIASSMNWGANPYSVTRTVFTVGGGVAFISQ